MSTVMNTDRRKTTVKTFLLKKKKKQPITMLTAYDYAMASIMDETEIDSILVGDSLGMVMLGHETTIPVTMEDMVHHCRAVARGAKFPLLVGDLPFMSYQSSVEEAVRNAGRLLKEGNMDAVKLEGGRERIDAVKAIVGAGIPVLGHLGLTPQSVHLFGGFITQGKTADTAYRILEDALLLEDAGCFGVVLESVPEQIATIISKELGIPTIGIGAGNGCDGQVLVVHDMLGLFDKFRPKFVKAYSDLHAIMQKAFSDYKNEVENRTFPTEEHSYTMREEELQEFLKLYKK